jgi:hypothetical protein
MEGTRYSPRPILREQLSRRASPGLILEIVIAKRPAAALFFESVAPPFPAPWFVEEPDAYFVAAYRCGIEHPGDSAGLWPEGRAGDPQGI